MTWIYKFAYTKQQKIQLIRENPRLLKHKTLRMVKLTATFLFLLASLAAPSLCAVIDDVVSEINTIAAAVNTLNNEVNAIPAGGQVSLLDAAVCYNLCSYNKQCANAL